VASDLISDDAGRVSASFTVPPSARNGNRIVEMTDGHYTARASLQINDPLVITRIQRIIQTTTITRIVRVPVVRTVWRTRTIFVRRDPLAQTFSFTQNRVISAVGLRITPNYMDWQIFIDDFQRRGLSSFVASDVCA
jgi:hypothetical protein